MKEKLERNKVYTLEVTGEQIAFICLLTGKTNGGWGSKFKLFNLCDKLIYCSNDPCSLATLHTIDLGNLYAHESTINEWLDSIFNSETEDQRKLRELKEQYEALGQKIKQMEG